jgi:hypothetical protein
MGRFDDSRPRGGVTPHGGDLPEAVLRNDRGRGAVGAAVTKQRIQHQMEARKTTGLVE